MLYWLQTAMRTAGNHALTFAIEQANRLRLPLLVYQGLRPDYPWASDRFHTFILESAYDLSRDFQERGIPYVFYLDPGLERRPAGSPPPLITLARRAALVVTDYFPTFIVPRQLRSLREKVDTPVIAVDSCTLIPLRYHDREYSSARAIRPRLLEALPHYLHPYADVELDVRRTVDPCY